MMGSSIYKNVVLMTQRRDLNRLIYERPRGNIHMVTDMYCLPHYTSFLVYIKECNNGRKIDGRIPSGKHNAYDSQLSLLLMISPLEPADLS